jgi:hypothetical protein
MADGFAKLNPRLHHGILKTLLEIPEKNETMYCKSCGSPGAHIYCSRKYAYNLNTLSKGDGMSLRTYCIVCKGGNDLGTSFDVKMPWS